VAAEGDVVLAIAEITGHRLIGIEVSGVDLSIEVDDAVPAIALDCQSDFSICECEPLSPDIG